MDGGSPIAPLERSFSEISAASTRSRSSHRSTVRASRRAKLVSNPSSSTTASSVDALDKSLTSFPSFSPGSPQEEDRPTLSLDALDGASSLLFKKPDETANKSPSPPRTAVASAKSAASSIVASLTASSPNPQASSSTFTSSSSQARNALFDDAPPLAPNKIPGALHLADDEHIGRLIAKHGAVGLVRQVAEDLAQRDAQISALRIRSSDRERALRKIILECGLSTLDLETRLRAVEHDAARGQHNRQVSDLMSDAMTDSVSRDISYYTAGQATVRAPSNGPLPVETDSQAQNKGTMKMIKDYFWGGGGSGRNSRAGSVNGDTPKQERSQQTVVRTFTSSDRRPTLNEDLFTPPDVESVRSSSRASSIVNGVTPARKSSMPFAATLVRLVAGNNAASSKVADGRGRAGSSGSGAGGSLRTSSVSSQRTNGSTRAVSTQGGPKSLMSMRRVTAGTLTAMPPGAGSRTRTEDRWDTMVVSPSLENISRQESYGPVEMDKILPLEGQPPTLSQLNNNYRGSGELTDRFGFIYDQQRKKRQRAAQLASQFRGSGPKKVELLQNGKPNLAAIITEDSSSSKWDVASEGRPGSPSSTEEGKSTYRWYDYLKVVTFQSGAERTTELLSDTPVTSAAGIEVTEGPDAPKSPGLPVPAIVTSEDRGFVPPASTPTSAVDTGDATIVSLEREPAAAAATFVRDEAEPVKQLLNQLNSLHDDLQRKRMDRWNEFQRKVRAERRKVGDSAVADARFHRMPETKLADGELIGIADLGNKGKVGRAKWSEFRSLVLGGIPVTLRAKVWAECSGALELRVPGYYDDLVSRPIAEDNADVVTQIRADINRTLTDNIFFRKGAGVERLHEVLLAYSRRNPEVGYCQGMNLIAANLLLVTPSAEDAFWLLAAIVEKILPAGYYDHSLLASRADQQVLRQYVAEVLPRLSAHFDALGIDLETMTFQWFLSVFTDCLSAEALFRVWDVILSLAGDGSTFLFQVALALLKLNETQLLTQCTSPAAVYTYINHQMTDHAISIDGLVQASEGLRRLVKREDVAARRQAAVAAKREVAQQREQERAARTERVNAARASRKAVAAAAVITGESVCASPTGTATPSIVASSRSVSPAPPLSQPEV